MLATRVDPGTVAHLDQLARRTRRTRAEVIRQALEAALVTGGLEPTPSVPS